MMKRFKSGYSHGVRVNLGLLESFFATSHVSKLHFMDEYTDWKSMKSKKETKKSYLKTVQITQISKPTDFIKGLIMNQQLDLTDVALLQVIFSNIFLHCKVNENFSLLDGDGALVIVSKNNAIEEGLPFFEIKIEKMFLESKNSSRKSSEKNNLWKKSLPY